MDKKIFDFIYDMSFKDATMRKAFPKEPKESEEKFKDRKQEARIVSEPFCYDYAEKLLKEEDVLSNNQIREIILKITKKINHIILDLHLAMHKN